MRNLINMKYSFILLLVASFAFLSCTDENDFNDKKVEGLPVSLSFELTTPAPNVVETRVNEENDTRLEKLALFFYKKNEPQSLPLVYDVEDLSDVDVTNPTNYKYNVSVPLEFGLTSGEWYIYAVANLHKGFWNKNSDIKPLKQMSKAEFDNYCIKKDNENINFTESSMLMTGKYGTNNSENETEDLAIYLGGGANTLKKPIHLQRSLAQIIFFFKNGEGVKFIPESYDLYNYSLSSTLMERRGWKGMANPSTIDYKGVGDDTQANFIDKKELPVYKNPNNVHYGFMFYMPENVQKSNLVDGKGPLDQAMREKHIKNDDKTDGKFLYAPSNATYVVVHGMYEGPGKTPGSTVTANVDYTIHLGDFSKGKNSKGQTATGRNDNFTVRRNTKYTFKVTINGVNSIITEAEAVSDDSETQPGAEGDVVNTTDGKPFVFDAHYETTIIGIPVDKAKSNSFSLVLKTPKTNGMIITTDVNDPELNDINWIKFGKPVSAGEYAKYPANGEGLMNIKELLNAFNNAQNYTNGKFYVSGDGKTLYLQVFVDENYYQDLADKKEFNKFINVPRRVLTLATGTKISEDKNSTYTQKPIFSFEQRSIKTMYDLTPAKFKDNKYIPFGLETVEDGYVDEEHTGATIISNNYKGTVTDYWGDTLPEGDNYSGNDMDDGYKNSVGIAGGLIGKEWDTYVNFSKNEMHSSFNLGLYQFLLRNRDLNGNGVIDEGEIRWYIPSVNQHIAIWNGYHALPESAHLNKYRLYYTSTNEEFRSLWAYEGSFGRYKMNDYEKFQLVRCIRPLTWGNKAIQKIKNKTSRSTAYDAQTRIFHVSNFGENAIRQAGIQVGEYLHHAQNGVKNKLPESFKVAKHHLGEYNEYGDLIPYEYTLEQIKSGHILDNYYEESDASDKGQWRIPNQRELMIMMLVWHDKKILKDSYDLFQYTASSTYYDEQTTGKDNRLFYIQKGRHLWDDRKQTLFITSSLATGAKFSILPVRDFTAN